MERTYYPFPSAYSARFIVNEFMIYRGIISAILSFRGSVNKGRAREHLFAFKLLLKVNKVIVCLTTLLELWFTPACFNLAHRFLQRHEVLRSPLVISEINRIRLTQNSTGTEFSGIIHTQPILMGLHQLRVPFTLQGYLKDLFSWPIRF